MNLDFSYYMPTRIIFGCGKLSELKTTPYLPGKKALIVIGSSGAMKKHGYLDRVTEYLKENSVESVVYDKIVPNPVSEHVEEGAAVARENGCDFVLGLGGGSTLDSSKSIALMAVNPGKYWDYINGGSGGGKTPQNPALPIVAITTTAGTGTEADPWTVITKTDTNEKIGYGNNSTFPVLSIVDPELTLSVPPQMTAYTGMDAFFHSVECYLATINQPTSDHLALEAIGLITKYLPIAVKDGNNIEARTKLAWANTEAGICESLSCCISHHSMEHALSAYHPEMAHGAGLTMLSVSYFSCLAEKHPARFPDMAKAMGEDVDALPEKERPFAFITTLKKLIKNIGLEEEKLTDYGVKREELRTLAENSSYTMGMLYDITPVELTLDDIVGIYKNAFT
ncbi:MAG: iron-containing alcohol dehydrogenase [Phycisphaerae bacterium]|nr:iron-containing alcohol dehydrogenase [Phycisphaerae bacterium]NIR65695.1 iron-containing alcohol dehydrogenase [candidate division Zixibacteria bacterium]NIP52758.1 iron-containing alcohol dehydrogenase [Phycisphaerae bacterium]NIS52049.1 iron-containing alcohol dehydrogenase [Phycisphaerae bacterium]NIU09588.1 iron-containing alcohol dehydrogenase [Phycisphaerae bacterium]